jgi:hypothetical protein
LGIEIEADLGVDVEVDLDLQAALLILLLGSTGNLEAGVGDGLGKLADLAGGIGLAAALGTGVRGRSTRWRRRVSEGLPWRILLGWSIVLLCWRIWLPI